MLDMGKKQEMEAGLGGLEDVKRTFAAGVASDLAERTTSSHRVN
jgi:hypothetical protein